MRLSDFDIEDYHDVANALTDGPSQEAKIWVDLRWTGGGGHVKIRDHDVDFGGRFVEGSATIEWRGENAAGQFFQSDPATTSKLHFAEVGHERNGRFFP
jgi:hypothetical protein